MQTTRIRKDAEFARAEGALEAFRFKTAACRRVIAASSFLRPALDPAVQAACDAARWAKLDLIAALAPLGVAARDAFEPAVIEAFAMESAGYVPAAHAACDVEAA
jgi:hypothetical protein